MIKPIDPPSFADKLTQVESGKSYIINGRAEKANEGGVFGNKMISALSNAKSTSGHSIVGAPGLRPASSSALTAINGHNDY